MSHAAPSGDAPAAGRRSPAAVRRIADRHALKLLAIAALAGAAMPAPALPVQVALLALAVALLGLPHGGLDGSAGRRLLAPRLGRLWLPAFLGLYLGLTGLVLAGWAIAPLATLAAFLIVAGLHFGAGDAEEGSRHPAREGALRGGLPIALPVIFHPAETGAIFALLTGTPALPATLPSLSLPLATLLGTLAVLVLAAHRRPLALAAEIGALTLIFALWPPLLAFGLYFTLLHAPRHMLADDPGRHGEPLLRPLLRLARAALPWTLSAALLAGLGFIAIGGLAKPDAAGIRTIFYGLSALTLPHILLERAVALPHRQAGPPLRASAPPAE